MKTLSTIIALSLCVNAFAQTPMYVPANDLVGWYSFSGTANDESGNANDGILMNGVSLTTDRYGADSSAFEFDGIDDFIWLNFLDTLNGASQLSLSYWLQSSLDFPNNPAGNYGTVFGHWKDDGQFSGPIGFQASQLNDGSVHVSFIGGQGFPSNPSIVDSMEWNHLVYVYDGSLDPSQRVALFKNGLFVQHVIVTDVPAALGTEATRTYLGAATGPTGAQNAWAFFQGKLDDVGIWNRSLTANEVCSLYSAGFGNCNDTCIITIYDTAYVNITDTNFINVTDTLTIDVATGLQAPDDINAISVYPNPANTHITIDNGNYSTIAGYELKITNSIGQTVFQSPVNQQQFTVDLSTWSGNGIYFLHVIDDGGNTLDIRKIVLQ